MKRLRRFARRFAAFMFRRDGSHRLREELEQHVAMQTADNIRAGMPPDEAKRQAMLKLGSVGSTAARYHDEQSLPVLDALSQDLRYVVRQLRKTPAFACTAIVTLAIGIGVNTTMFTVVYSVLLRDLPYTEPERLMQVVQAHNRGHVLLAEFDIARAQSHAFSSIAAYRGGGEYRIGPPEQHHWISTFVISTDFFRTLGVQPQLGREFTDDETRPGAPAVVILSDHVWRNVFAADPQILGRTVRLNDATAVVVGVLPAGFWFSQQMDAVLPLRPSGGLSDTGTNTQVLARLAPGTSPSNAQAELESMTQAIRDVAGDSLHRTYRGLAAIPHRDWLVGDVRQNLLLLFGATGILLLIACGNLALLLLTRFASRGNEIAVRVALGSSRRRLLSQFLTEHLLITLMGAGAGVLAAQACIRIFVALMPFDLPSSSPISVNGAVLGFTVLTALATALLVTLAPFFSSRRVNIPMSLRADSKSAGASAIRTRMRTAFIVGEVALSTTLLVGAGLLVQTLYRTTQQQLGFVPDNVLTFETPLSPERGKDPAVRAAFTTDLLARLQRLPGVRAVAATNLLPLTGQGNLPTQRDGYPDQSIGGMEVRAVTSDYFTVMGMSIRRGRPISADDVEQAAPIVVINETVARAWWPDSSGIGDRLTIGRYKDKQLLNDLSREVIGVVGDAKTMRLQASPRPTVYVPMTSAFGSGRLFWTMKVDARRDLAQQIRATVSSIDPAQRITRLRQMDDIVAGAAATPRFNAALFALFGAVALTLTLVGLYGVLSFLVAQRRREIGTRLALGASRGRVLRAVVGQGLSVTAIGLVIGLTVAFVISRWLSTLLFGVLPHDPVSFAGAALLVLGIGAAASYIPARRAATIDPLIAMRGD
jgi:predicted permease